MKFNKTRIRKILSEFPNKKILVIGDVMVDAYYWGKIDRISAEAPVPIVEVENVNFNPGGAGNVALNLSTLGAYVSIIAIIGNDYNGEVLSKQFKERGIDTSNIQIIDNYQTPIKTRVIAQDQQVIRIDQEKNSFDINKQVSNFEIKLKEVIKNVDGIVLADYNKGLLSEQFIQSILQIADKNSKPVYVDPKNKNFHKYLNVRLFKPNIAEFKNAMGNNFSTEKVPELAKEFLAKNKADILLITRGADEALLFMNDFASNIPTITQSVHDVSGAGDTVISTFALADLSGAEPVESANIANIAASIVCSKVGVVPIKIDELKSKLLGL